MSVAEALRCGVVFLDYSTNSVHRLFGDSDGNAIVDGVDFGAFRNAFNTNNTIFDFDNSGLVDGVDFGAFRSHFNQSV